MRTHLDQIITKHGEQVTITTGSATQSINAIVGTRRIERSSRSGGYGNESALSITARTLDLSIPITPHTTTCKINSTLWRVVSFADSQAQTGVFTITLGPINP